MTDESKADISSVLDELKKPDLYFEFPAESGRAPLKMTYGLEMDLRRMLPDPGTALTLLLADPYTQDYVIRRCLTPLTKIVTKPEEELIPSEDVDLDNDTTEALLMWAADHAIYFFAKRTAGLENLGVRFAQLLPKTAQPALSSNGSEDSASTTPSVGDSES